VRQARLLLRHRRRQHPLAVLAQGGCRAHSGDHTTKAEWMSIVIGMHRFSD
jgi:hypothetical protein